MAQREPLPMINGGWHARLQRACLLTTDMGLALGYDAAGNLTDDGDKGYEYDVLGRSMSAWKTDMRHGAERLGGHMTIPGCVCVLAVMMLGPGILGCASKGASVTCDLEQAEVVYVMADSAHPGDRPLRLTALLDGKQNCHLFWVTHRENDDSSWDSLWHTWWAGQPDGGSSRRPMLLITKTESLYYSATRSKRGVAVAWQDETWHLYCRQWDAAKSGWTDAVPGPKPEERAAGPPFFFPDHGTVLWESYDDIPIDLNKLPTSQEMTEQQFSWWVMATVHSSRPVLYAASMSSGAGKAWSEAVPVLVGERNARGNMSVFQTRDDVFSIFVETSVSGSSGVASVEYYRHKGGCGGEGQFKGRWSVITDEPRWWVFPVDGRDSYYLFCMGAIRPEADTEELCWTTSETPGEQYVLTKERKMLRCGPPVGAFRSNGLSDVGVVVWRDVGNRVVGYVRGNGRWSGPIDTTVRSSEEMAVVLLDRERGFLFVTSAREVRRIPFWIDWE